jgi:hypothetical protein
MKKQMVTVAALAAAISLNACATIMNGKQQDVAFTSTPGGATVFIDGQNMGVTPASLSLARKDSHTVRLDLAGYQPYEMTLERGVSGWVWGNLLFGGLIGLVVDVTTGAMYKLSPEQVNGTLVTRQASLNGKTVIQVELALSADPSWEKVGQLEAAH